MKYCSKCLRTYEDSVEKCPVCDETLITPEVTAEEDMVKYAKGICPDALDKVLSAVLMTIGLALAVAAVIYGKDELGSWFNECVYVPSLCFLFGFGTLFKRFLFTHFTWQSISARHNRINPNTISPPAYYRVLQKVVLCGWAVYSVVILVFILRFIVKI